MPLREPQSWHQSHMWLTPDDGSPGSGLVSLGWNAGTIHLQYVGLPELSKPAIDAISTAMREFNTQCQLMVVLYAMDEERDSENGNGQSELRVKVARRTRGFGTPRGFPICGERGGFPRGGRPIPPGSLAEQAARYGTAHFALGGGCAALARPVIRQGKLTRVVVVAVPESCAAILGPQMVASGMPGRRRKPIAAVAAVGPW